MSDLNGTFTAEEQAQFEQMRQDDGAAPEAATIEPAAPAPETSQAEQQANDPNAQPRQQMVPHGALHEERERRKESERMLAEERQRSRVLEERTNLILQQMQRYAAPPQPAQPQPAPLPDVAQDPLGHLLGNIQEVRQNVLTLAQQQQQQLQAQQQAQAIQQLQAHAIGAEQEFRRATPDYDAAVNHLAAQRDHQLQIAGVLNPAERLQLIQQEALGLTARAVQAGRNPAQMVYELARAYGYTPAAQAAAQAPAPAQAAPAATEEGAADRLQRAAAGQQQARSIGQLSGAAPPGIDARRIANMSEREFQTWYAKASPEQKAEVYGGEF